MQRIVRYQGAIVRDHHVLLIRHCEHESGHSYWLLPGGGIEPQESEEACVRREMREETSLVVQVERLLLDEPADGKPYWRRKTYLCTIIAGEPAPGHEPEEDAASVYGIVEVGWFDLRNASSWGEVINADPITYPQLQRIRVVLGY